MEAHGSVDDEQMDTLPLPSTYEGNLDPLALSAFMEGLHELVQPLSPLMEHAAQPFSLMGQPAPPWFLMLPMCP